MKLTFTGTDKVRAYRGDGLYCIADKPETCTIDVPDNHACRLIREHHEWWDVPEESKSGLKDSMQKLLNRGKVNGSVRLRWVGTRAQRYYRGDGIYCDAENEHTCIIYVNNKKASQLLKDFPRMWINLDEVKIEDAQKPQQPKVNLTNKSVLELKDIAREKGIDIEGVSEKSELIKTIENPEPELEAKEETAQDEEEIQEEPEELESNEIKTDAQKPVPAKHTWGRKKKK